MGLNLTSVKQFENLEFLARELVEGFITGLHRSPYHGFSVEFAEHKLYNYGESIKNIDWKVYARTDRLYTKQYEEETNLRCTVLLDISSSMYYPDKSLDKITFSIYASAALAFLMTKQRDAVGLIGFDDEIRLQTPTKSTRTHLNTLLQHLEGWLKDRPDAPRKTNIAETIHIIAEKIHKRSLVIIFTDMFQQATSTAEIMAALMHLKHKKHEVLLFHVTDQTTERQFDFEDRPYRFIDSETRDSITVTPTLIQKQYRERLNKLYQDVKIGCGQLKIDLIEADTKDPFEKILGAYLIKRRKMRT